MIVGHLKHFDTIVPQILSAVILKELKNTEDIEMQKNAIQKFAKLWKFTGMFQNYRPFANPYKDDYEINLQEGKKFFVLHEMIMFLENKDPNLRLQCKSWLL